MSKTKNEIQKPLYDEGYPLEIRANCSASVGKFMQYGTDVMGDELEFIPIAARFFTDELFKTKADIEAGRDTTKKWAEIFFVHEGVVCVVLFHNISVENLLKAIQPFRYKLKKDGSRTSITDYKIRANFKSMKNGKGQDYYSVDFRIKLADENEVGELQESVDGLTLYRVETVTGTESRLGTFNFPSLDEFAAKGLLQLPEPQSEAA